MVQRESSDRNIPWQNSLLMLPPHRFHSLKHNEMRPRQQKRATRNHNTSTWRSTIPAMSFKFLFCSFAMRRSILNFWIIPVFLSFLTGFFLTFFFGVVSSSESYSSRTSPVAQHQARQAINACHVPRVLQSPPEHGWWPLSKVPFCTWLPLQQGSFKKAPPEHTDRLRADPKLCAMMISLLQVYTRDNTHSYFAYA